MAKARSSRPRRSRAAAAEREPVPSAAPPPFNPEQHMIDSAKAFVAQQQEGVTVQAGRVVRKYSPLERDLALLEIQTDQGFFEVVAGRDGSMTLFHPGEQA